MTYYDTIEEDLARAKEILAKGRWSTDDPYQSTSGAIFGADIYAAYKLLESFVAEIEQLRADAARERAARRIVDEALRQALAQIAAQIRAVAEEARAALE